MLKLEIFETASLTEAETVFDAQQAEKLRETAFEQGYAAGWQDALEHMRNEDAMRRIASEEALQTISFGYNEAHAALQGAFVDLVETVFEKIIPEAMALAMPLCLHAELTQMANTYARPPVRISCAPSACATLEPIIASVPGVEITLVPEPSFSEAQVALSFGAQERVIDLDFILNALRESLALNKQRKQNSEKAHG